MANKNPSCVVGVIGGSGLYQIDGIEITGEETITTPFGEPSDTIVRGRYKDVTILFLPRHGRHHHLLPFEVNYRANIYALKTLGATWCIGISAVGSLHEDLAPGNFVIPDQIIDRTRQRKNTFFGEGVVAHVSFADPYCPVLRKALYESCLALGKELEFKTWDGGTYVCMEGPAFSTRAESHLYRSMGAKIIGMTNLPEAKLAREAEIAYATLALVTDYDCWKQDGDDAEVSKILAVLRRNAVVAKRVVAETISRIKTLTPSALCSEALKNALMTDLSKAPRETVERLRPLLARHL